MTSDPVRYHSPRPRPPSERDRRPTVPHHQQGSVSTNALAIPEPVATRRVHCVLNPMTEPNPRILTTTLERCGCPPGAYRATIPRLGITTYNDNPHAALDQAHYTDAMAEWIAAQDAAAEANA